MPVGHLYVFFGRMSVQIFCSFFNHFLYEIIIQSLMYEIVLAIYIF